MGVVPGVTKLSTASHAMLPLRSLLLYGRLPNMCPSELTPQVTWCSRAMRTPPAQSRARSAPVMLRVTAHPSPKGTINDSAIHSGVSFDTMTMSRSASRSRLHFSGFDWVPEKSQPMWAWPNPRSCGRNPWPKLVGEWGSPGWSA